MKKISQIILHTSIALTLLLSVCNFAFAQTPPKDYVLLAPLPGTVGSNQDVTKCPQDQTTGQPACTTTLSTYLPGMINFIIGIAGVLAFIMITYGGLLYATSDAIAGKSSGKDKIQGALWGLALVLGAWVILNTINPELLHFSLSLPKPNTVAQTDVLVVNGDTSTGTYTNGGQPLAWHPTNTDNEASLRADLTKNGVSVNAGPCTTQGVNSGCTDLDGLPSWAVNQLGNMAKECKCSIQITGGTEGGHTTHGPGEPVVDITGNGSTGLHDYIEKYGGTPQPTANCPRCALYDINSINGVRAKILYEPPGTEGSSGEHWHVVFR